MLDLRSGGACAHPVPVMTRHHVELHLAVVLFGGVAVFAEFVDLAPGPLVLARTAVAAVFVFGLQQLRRAGRGSGTDDARRRPRSRRDLALLASLGIVLAVHWVAFFHAIQVSSVSVAVISVSTFPIFTALFESLGGRHRPRVLDLALASLAVAGVAVIMPTTDRADATVQGVLWGIAAAVLFAVLTIINARMVSAQSGSTGYSSNTVALYQYAGAALVLAPFFGRDLVPAIGEQWLLLLLLGVVFTGVAHTLFISSMRSIRTQTASLMVSLEPLYAIVLAWLILAERPGPRIMIGGALILTAAVTGTLVPVTASRPSRDRGGAAGPEWLRCIRRCRR